MAKFEPVKIKVNETAMTYLPDTLKEAAKNDDLWLLEPWSPAYFNIFVGANKGRGVCTYMRAADAIPPKN